MSEKPPILWLTEADVVSLVPLNDAIGALERTLAELGQGSAFNVPKAMAAYGDGSSLHSLGSAAPALGYAGFKNWVYTKQGASALYAMFDARDGSAVAVIEAAALGQLRTSAITGVASRWLSAPDASTLALLGTGSQALTQAIAVALVRELTRIAVYGRNPARRAEIARRLREEIGCEVVESESVAEATRDAQIVTLVTRASEPLLDGRMLARGAHLNAIGAILPKNAEFEQDVFERCDAVVVDDLSGVQKNSREFIARYAASGDWSAVTTIGEVIARQQRRAPGADVTLFKSMGMGVSDLAIAMLALERSRERGIGRRIDQPARGALRWQLPARLERAVS